VASAARSPRSVAQASLPTRHGLFHIVPYVDGQGREHAALVGDLGDGLDVPVRIHSECLTGDVFQSLRCDCRQQLEAALAYIQEHGGILLYLRQEGRGIGLANKIKAYELQEQGLDTNQANEALGFRADERTYEVAAAMLHMLGVRTVKLLSNNPHKIRGLLQHGILVTDRIPLVAKANPLNERYLRTKLQSGHFLHGALPQPSHGARAASRTSMRKRRATPPWFEDFSDT
jgi:3,4-dihydroxy 2-butanone 4-phosphate synthase / GTP cyclohydrolase II